MNTRRSGTAQRILIGLAVGAMAAAVYHRRASILALAGPRVDAVLPSGARALARAGGSPMQKIGGTGGEHGLLAALQDGPHAVVDEVRRYVETARKQIDLAIAEGKVAAAQTRQELEARFAQAKENPGRGASAFI